MDFLAYIVAYGLAAKFGHWAFTKWVWPWAQELVITDKWTGPAATDVEYRERISLAISAGTGGVLGFLIACAFENLYFRVHDPQSLWPSGTHLVSMLLLTFIGVKLFAPIHSLIERAVHSRLRNGQTLAEPLAAETTTATPAPATSEWESAATVGVIVFAFLLLDEGLKQVLDKELETLTSEGGLGKSVYTLLLSAIWPGIITYYWVAAIRKQTGEELLTAPLGSTTAAWLLIVGGMLAVFSVTFAYVNLKNGVGGILGGMVLLVEFVVLILVVAVLSAIGAILSIGLVAAAGMMAIQLTRRHRGWALLAGVIAANLVLAVPYLLALVYFYDSLNAAEVPEQFKLLGREREALITITQTLFPPVCWIAALMLEPRFRSLLATYEPPAGNTPPQATNPHAPPPV